MNYEKSNGPILHEISHLINKIMKVSLEDNFNQCKKDLLRTGQAKPSMIQLVNDMMKNKEYYVGYVIDHTWF